MKSKIWPQRPRKWPLDDLLTSMTSEVAQWIFSKIIFFKSVHQAEENELLLGFLVKLLKSRILSTLWWPQRTESKTGICKSLNRKPINSSFSSAWCTDLKKVIFEKIHWATSEVIEVKRLFDLSDLKNDLMTSTTSEVTQWIFSKIKFLKSVHQTEENELTKFSSFWV